jgi:hypothetical protein
MKSLRKNIEEIIENCEETQVSYASGESIEFNYFNTDKAVSEIELLITKVLQRAADYALVSIEFNEDYEKTTTSGTYIDSHWIKVDKNSITNVDLNDL